MKIGFIGLGIMGKSMALNLVKAGFQVTVWNRTPGKTEELTEHGAKEAQTPANLADRSDIIIIMVNDTPDVAEVIFGENGLFGGLSDGKIVVDMRTISPDATETFAARLAEIGCEMLDAPVSGGDVGAKDGSLTIMVGGKRSGYEQCHAIFAAMGKNIVYCGEAGAGQRTKMINQILCGLHAVALSERVGLDVANTAKVVASGAAGSWALDNYGPRILKGDLSPGFKLSMQHKDLRIAYETAKKYGDDFNWPINCLPNRGRGDWVIWAPMP